MYKEPEAMRQIHEIQEKLYEEMKDMSDEEKRRIIHKEALEAEKRFGLKLKRASRTN